MHPPNPDLDHLGPQRVWRERQYAAFEGMEMGREERSRDQRADELGWEREYFHLAETRELKGEMKKGQYQDSALHGR